MMHIVHSNLAPESCLRLFDLGNHGLAVLVRYHQKMLERGDSEFWASCERNFLLREWTGEGLVAKLQVN
jgi:hypothetical protein